MYFVFRTPSSTGARELADALGGSRLRRFEGGRFFRRREGGHPVNVRNGDILVMWGSFVQGIANGIRTLNNVAIHSKFEDAEILRRAGISTVEVSRQRPADQVQAAAVDPAIAIHRELLGELEDLVDAPFARNDVYRRGLDEVQARIQRFREALALAAPVGRRMPAGDWVGRVNDHTGGTDLLTPPPNPDFYVKKVELTREFRIHTFQGLSIRAGEKVPREGFSLDGRAGARCNPWIRSFDGGWRIKYDEFKSKESMRTLADQAVKALGLDFGAVDIGMKADKSLIVLEVNRAPGLEGGTVAAYQGAIERWSAGNWAARPAAPRAQGQRRRAA